LLLGGELVWDCFGVSRVNIISGVLFTVLRNESISLILILNLHAASFYGKVSSRGQQLNWVASSIEWGSILVRKEIKY
jgi:hypothetical protein